MRPPSIAHVNRSTSVQRSFTPCLWTQMNEARTRLANRLHVLVFEAEPESPTCRPTDSRTQSEPDCRQISKTEGMNLTSEGHFAFQLETIRTRRVLTLDARGHVCVNRRISQPTPDLGSPRSLGQPGQTSLVTSSHSAKKVLFVNGYLRSTGAEELYFFNGR